MFKLTILSSNQWCFSCYKQWDNLMDCHQKILIYILIYFWKWVMLSRLLEHRRKHWDSDFSRFLWEIEQEHGWILYHQILSLHRVTWLTNFCWNTSYQPRMRSWGMRSHLSINLKMRACVTHGRDLRSYSGDVLIMVFLAAYSWKLSIMVSTKALDWWWTLQQMGPCYLSLTMRLMKF